MRIRVREHVLDDNSVLYQSGQGNNIFHAYNAATFKRLTSVIMYQGGWREVRGTGGLGFEYSEQFFQTREECLKFFLTPFGVDYKEEEQREEQASVTGLGGTSAIRRAKKAARNEYGFFTNSKAHQFCQMLMAAGEKGITMEDAIAADWNDDDSVFYWVINKMIKNGQAYKDKAKRMYLMTAKPKESTPAKKSKPKPV